MTIVKYTPDHLLIKEFTTAKQTKLFQSLQQSQFSGLLIISSLQQTKWKFYFARGELIYGTGGVHPIRRWRRHLAIYLPHISFDDIEIKQEIASFQASEDKCWEYELLLLWLERGKITPQQASQMVNSILEEILFDITYTMEVMCEMLTGLTLLPQFKAIDLESVMTRVEQNWLAWQTAKISDRSPNLAPVIWQKELLKQRVSSNTYQQLSRLLDGNKTLRDLATEISCSCYRLTSSFLPYFQSKILGLVEVSDLAFDDNLSVSLTSHRQPLIACVDDSPMINRVIEQIVSTGGYRFIGINNELKAIPLLLAHKPDLIFLDIIMPQINGYELCSQLRKHSAFKETPIIFLTSSDGIIDRVKARFVGSTDFISKTVNPDKLLQAIAKHIYQLS